MIPLFAFSPEIRRVIYTTAAIESPNRAIRKAIKTRGSLPFEEAAERLIYLSHSGPRENIPKRAGEADSGEPVRHKAQGALHPDEGLRVVAMEPGRRQYMEFLTLPSPVMTVCVRHLPKAAAAFRRCPFGALVTAAFDPYQGFYHRPRHGRPALALALAMMEPFRPLLSDSTVLTVNNNGEIGAVSCP